MAAILVGLATRAPGPGLDPDAMAYVGAATSLVRTGTFRVPTGTWGDDDSTSSLSLWPPGYPTAIAGAMVVRRWIGATPAVCDRESHVTVACAPSRLTRVEAIEGGRDVNIVAAAVTAAAVFFLVSGAVGIVAGVVAVVGVFATPAVFDVHLSVLSEPLFIAVLAVTLLVMVYARDRVFLLSVLAATAVMVRYVGGSVPAAAVTWMLLDTRFAWRRRLRRAVGVAVVPALALGAWFVRTAAAPDRHGTPHVAMYGHWDVTLQQASQTMMQWLTPGMPDGAGRVVLAVVLVIVVVGVVVTAAGDTAGRSRFRPEGFVRIAGILGAALTLMLWYVVVLVVARLFVGGTIPFDWRICAPVIFLVEMMIVVSAAHWWRAHYQPVRIVAGLVGLAWIVAAAIVTGNDAVTAATDGSDFAETSWKDSQLIQWIRQDGRTHTLYSNWPPAVYFHTDRIARELPDSTEVRSELPDFAETLRETNGVIVGFSDSSPDFVAPDSLAKLLRLREVARFPDGIVWAP